MKDYKQTEKIDRNNWQQFQVAKQGYHFVGNDQFSGGFWGPDDQKYFLRVLLRFVDWGSEKLFLGVSTQIKKFFFLKKD